ncbi:MAG TPA: glycosyltransferase family A protein [Polyangiaceae bacterium]
MLASAIVCTKDRSRAIPHVVAALLADTEGVFELIVIDQSEGSETERALDPWRDDPRLLYQHSATRGKGAGLNEGIRVARGEIVVFTDDDCQPPRQWVASMAEALTSQPSAVIAFCQVLPVAHDRNAGYVPTYLFKKNRLLRTVSSICGGLGLGAGMAVRRDFALAIGGFDESFGPGARFPSADEWDLAIRALLNGKHVYETAELAIVHDGFRTFEEGLKHARRDWMAIGAVCAKPLRAGYLEAAIVPIWLLTTRALLPPLTDLIHLRKPRGLGRILAFARGFADGFATPVDAKTLRFR